MNRKVFCTSAQHPVYFYVSSSSGQLYSLICDIHDNGRYRPNAARSTYPGKKNRVGQKSPQVYHRKPYHLFRLGRGHLQFSLVSVRGRFISAQRYGYCINSPGAGDDFWCSAHSKSSPTIARRALCVVTKSPIEPHSPLIRNNRFKTAANDRRAKAPSNEPGIACSSLRLVAFKICWYTFCLMASSVIIFSLQKGKVLHDEAA